MKDKRPRDVRPWAIGAQEIGRRPKDVRPSA